MESAAVFYDVGRAHDLAIVVAGIVPVLLVAAFAVPVPRVLRSELAPGALVELLAAAALLTFALLTEMLALFGVAYGLGHTDQSLLFVLLFVTGVAAIRRIIAPLVRTYATDRHIPESRLWGGFITVTLALAVGMTYLLAYAERQ